MNRIYDQIALETVDFIPEKIESGKLYFAPKYDVAIHLCPCGCGNKVVTDFNRPIGSSWKLDTTTVTLLPSVYSNQLPCKSHYFITNGYIKWV